MTHPATTGTGLARVTLQTPQRRIDVALPEQVALAELLPDLLRHAGIGLADDGEQHGGWMVRRGDGAPLAEGRTLNQHGVRDGEVLHLVPARTVWPELEYDDVVEAIAEGARRRGSAWSPSHTRAATLAGGAVLLTAAVLAMLRGGPQWSPGGYLCLTVAALLLVGGVLASRAYGDGIAGGALAGFAMPYAFSGGALLLGDGATTGPLVFLPWLGAAQLLVGCVAIGLFALLGATGVGYGLRIFTAGGVVGLLGGITALLAMFGVDNAAAVLLAGLVCGIGLLPVMAIRFGKVPVPSAAPARPVGAEPDSFAVATPAQARQAASEMPARSQVFASVARSDELLTGALLGYAVLTASAGLVLAVAGGLAGEVLVGVASTALLLRSRLFVTVRQRTPLVVGGLVGHALLLTGIIGAAADTTRAVFAVGVVVLALVVVLAGQTWSHRAPSPYVGRAADLFDLLVVVSVVPVAAWALGIYSMIQSWAA